MDVSLLNDAFKKLSILDEDVFTADDEGAEELDSFIDDSEKDAKDEITVADVSAEEDGDLEDSYVGKAVIDCTVCHSKLFKDVDDIQIDETSGLANVDDECPYCTSTDGYNVIGIISEYSDNANDTDSTVDTNKEDIPDDEVEEGLLTRDVNVNLDAHNFGGSNNDVSVLSPGNLLGGNKDVNEGLLSRDVNLSVDAHEFGGNGNNVSVLGGNMPTKEDLDDSEECDDEQCEEIDHRKSHIRQGVKESFDSVEIVKDGEKIEIKSEPAEEDTDSEEEVIEPLDDGTKEEIISGGETDESDDGEYSEDDTDQTVDESYSMNEAKNPNFKMNMLGNKFLSYIGKSNVVNVTGGKIVASRCFDIQNNKITRITFGADIKTIESGAVTSTCKELSSVTISGASTEVKRNAFGRLPNLSYITIATPNIDTGAFSIDKDQNVTISIIVPNKYLPDMYKRFENVNTPFGKLMKEALSDKIGASSNNNPNNRKNTAESLQDDDKEDVNIDEVAEKEFDKLGESYLKSIYENVESYKTHRATVIGDKLKLEGIITFKSGNRKNTAFLFESKEITRRGKLKFVGENCQITKNKKAFTLVGNMQGNKFIAESLNYNYHAMNNKKPVRVYGTKRITK